MLFAEDNAMNRLVLESFIRRMGAISVVAVNGQEAINMVRQRWIDIVLLDMNFTPSGKDAQEYACKKSHRVFSSVERSGSPTPGQGSSIVSRDATPEFMQLVCSMNFIAAILRS